MELRGEEVIKLIEEAIDTTMSRNNENALVELLAKNPNWGFKYTEYLELEIRQCMTEILLVSLCMARAASMLEEEKENAK